MDMRQVHTGAARMPQRSGITARHRRSERVLPTLEQLEEGQGRADIVAILGHLVWFL